MNATAACYAVRWLDLCLVLLLLAACGKEMIGRAEVERFIGQPLPAGTREFRGVSEAGIDRLVRARFEAPAAEVDSFTRALTGGELRPGSDPGLVTFGHDLNWWPRSLPAGYAGAESHGTPANRSFRLMSEPSATPGWSTLYMVAFSL